MIRYLDRAFVRAGLDETELQSLYHRPWLYAGILTSACIVLVFLPLALWEIVTIPKPD